MNTHPQSLYDQDFYAWTLDTADKLRSHDLSAIDVEHLMEEIEDMSARQRQALRSRLAVLIMHLLKWRYQPELRSPSWKKTIKTQRLDISYLFDDSPSLKHYVDSLLLKAYEKAKVMASKETGKAEAHFPIELPYTLEQILDNEFYPIAAEE